MKPRGLIVIAAVSLTILVALDLLLLPTRNTERPMPVAAHPEAGTESSPTQDGPPMDEFNRAEEEYEAVRRELRSVYEEHAQTLEPELLNPVEENLGFIEKAVVDLLAAISKHPDNPSLRKMLLDMYREEVALLGNALTFSNQ